MDKDEEVANKSAHLTMGNHQLVIITKLLQVVGNMRHIDELFLWLSHITIQRLNVQVVQFWAMQVDTTGQMSSELRTTACQNTALPQHVVINKTLAEITGRLLNKQRSVPPQSIGNTFSLQHMNLFARYNLNYWASHYMSNPILLPPAKNDFSNGKAATPLAITVSLFLQNMPSPRLMPTLSSILEQIIPIAKSHRLLLTTDSPAQDIRLSNQQSGAYLVLSELIPRRSQEANRPMVNNPFTSSVVIRDKKARHLYFAIDGHKNVAELSNLTQLNKQEIYTALCLLLTQHHIYLYEPGGLRVDSAQLLKTL